MSSSAQSPTHSAQNYIVSPLYDGFFFIGSPLIAMALGTIIFLPSVLPTVNFGVELPWLRADFSKPFVAMAIKVFIQAHLVLVFLRSHLNPKINTLHPIRFFVVPSLLAGRLTLLAAHARMRRRTGRLVGRLPFVVADLWPRTDLRLAPRQ